MFDDWNCRLYISEGIDFVEKPLQQYLGVCLEVFGGQAPCGSGAVSGYVFK